MTASRDTPEPVGGEEPLADFPLHSDSAETFALPLASEEAAVESEPPSRVAAPLPLRWMAFTADTAVLLLLEAAAILGAIAVRGQTPSLHALVWASLFLLYFSFFATVIPLTLFGKTVGMALAGLSARDPATARGLSASESALRWLGGVVTGAALGIPLLFTRRHAEAPTLADRLSGRTLVRLDSA